MAATEPRESGEAAFAPAPRRDPYAALRVRDFRLLIGATFLAIIGEQMMNVAIGWELYQRTHAALALGLVGLVQVLPVVLFALPAGHAADRYNRKRIMIVTMLLLAVCASGLALLSWQRGPLLLIYACLLCIGMVRAFQGPATGALLAQVVPPDIFASAATWESSAWQASGIIGPALGGLLVAAPSGSTLVYVVNAAILLVLAGALAFIRPRPVPPTNEPPDLHAMFAGLRFVWSTKVLLAAITLDMFAVLLGGATALMPIFATDVLHVGASGLGWLRTAPAVGAIGAALLIAHLPPFKHAGRTLLAVVAGFGLATIVFGLSRSFGLSLVMLAVLGALDNVSVVIRSTLVLTRTPDLMRGRVNAVHSVFIGISNELGAFESGIAAAAFGAIGAVVGGGIGTMVVVGLVAVLLPEVRRLRQLDEHSPANAE